MHNLSRILIIFSYLYSNCITIDLPNNEFIATLFRTSKRSSCNAIIYSKTKLLSSRDCLNRENHSNEELEACYYPGQCLTNTNYDFCTKVTPVYQTIYDSDIVVLDVESEFSLFDESVAANFNPNWNVTEFLGITGYLLLCSGKVIY